MPQVPQRYSAGMPARDTFNPYTAGAKRYGLYGHAPNTGKTSNLAGYRARDNVRARKIALGRKLKAEQSGRYASPDATRSR